MCQVAAQWGTQPGVAFDFPPPVMTALSPENGASDGGTLVTILGSQLQPDFALSLGTLQVSSPKNVFFGGRGIRKYLLANQC